MSLWMACFLSLAIVVLGANAMIQQNEGLLTLRDATPIMMTAVVSAGWLYRTLVPFRLIVWVVTIVLLLVALPITWSKMKTYPFQNQEAAFIAKTFSMMCATFWPSTKPNSLKP